MKSESPVLKYTCPKCGGRNYRVRGVRIDNTAFKQAFSIPGTRYTAVICEKCNYAEFYNLPVKRINEAFMFSQRT